MSYFGGNLVCTLQATFPDGFFSNFVMEVYHGEIYTPVVFGDAAPSALVI